MVVEIFEGSYKGIKSFIMENEIIRTEFVCLGGKMVSLIDKIHKREYLWQNVEETNYQVVPYGHAYGESEFSGFDEMFPSIVECFYEDYPWKGTHIPDHGELWTLEWNCHIERDSIILCVDGVRFPYTFEKRVYFSKNNIITSDYRVKNRSSFDMDFIWAAHPLINLEEGMQVFVPNSAKEAVVTQSATARIGKYGDIQTWPNFLGPNEQHYRADIMRPKSQVHFEKYFFRDKLEEGWCTLQYKDGCSITFSFPPDKVPHLGFWINEGGVLGQYNIAPEPCTGSMDRIDVAKLQGQMSKLSGKGSYEWFLNITLDSHE